MSIASELTALNGYILGAYDEINTKGGTVPANKNMANLASAIATISGGGGGGGGSDLSAQPRLTSYNRNTGVLTGTNLGTSGVVYVFDRMQNKGVAVATSSWSNTSITLSTPVDLANLTGTTSIWAVPSGGTESTKLLLRGDIAVTGYGRIYYKQADDSISYVQMTTTTHWNYLANNSTISKSFVIDGHTIFTEDIVGVEVGETPSITSAGFCRNFHNLNQPLYLNNISIIGQSLLSECPDFNQPVVLGVSSATISSDFLKSCTSFNQPLDLSMVSTVGGSFMESCTSFNQPVDLSSATTLGASFMKYCVSFNSPIDVSSVTAIQGASGLGYGFLSYCFSFNQPLSLPEVTSISNSFMDYCSMFNQPLSLPKVTSIGTYFMTYCYRFNQPLSLPNVTSIKSNFMAYTRSLASKVTLGAASVTAAYMFYDSYLLPELDVGSSTIVGTSLNQTLAVQSNTCKAYINGVTLTGANASTWKSTLADRTSTPYRKLIDGTA